MSASTLKTHPDGHAPDSVGEHRGIGRVAERSGEPRRAFDDDSFKLDASRRTFSQARRRETLPRALELEELPAATRVKIWNLFYAHLGKSTKSGWVVERRRLTGEWADLLLKVHVCHDDRPIDEWDNRFRRVCRPLRQRLETQPFNEVLALIQFVLRQGECPAAFRSSMQRIFARDSLAYRILDLGDATIVPAATETEGEAVATAIRELGRAGLAGSETHLRQSADCIDRGDWAGSLRESIHAVESVARWIAPEKTRSLTRAIDLVDRDTPLHPRLKQACKMLYRYTSDEQGIRHALLDRSRARVGMEEALFMLGACASFASYLWRKHSRGETS